MAEGSPARTLVAAALLLSLAAIAVWGVAQWRSTSASPAAPPSLASVPGDTPPSSEPSPPPAAEPAPSPAPAAEPTPDPTANGPATGPYAAFSPSHQLTHPDTDPDIRFWYDTFGYHTNGEKVGEWTNKEELWDSVVRPLRAIALDLGPEYTEPLWDNQSAVPASTNVRWSNTTTSGKGELVEFYVVYTGPRGQAIERYWAFLIDTLDDGSGNIVASGLTRDYPEQQYRSYTEQDEAIGRAAWNWVLAQDAIN